MGDASEAEGEVEEKVKSRIAEREAEIAERETEIGGEIESKVTSLLAERVAEIEGEIEEKVKERRGSMETKKKAFVFFGPDFRSSSSPHICGESHTDNLIPTH